ncbi:MAG: hypothetical protein JRG75_01750 [Deltaproteobacteria bacterium]|nr:hypothetical protein [Deltaproteobacteria bacterium]
MIIQYGENLLLEFFEKHLDQTITSYIDYRKAVDTHFGKWLEIGTDVSEMARGTMNFPQSFFESFSRPARDGEKKKKRIDRVPFA